MEFRVQKLDSCVKRGMEDSLGRTKSDNKKSNLVCVYVGEEGEEMS